MEKYRFTQQIQSAYESLQQPFAIYQFTDKRVVPVVLSDGFCELFGYEDRAQAYHDMDNYMYKDTHPDDVARIADAALRFAVDGGEYEVIYRTGVKDGSGYKMVHAQGRHVCTDDGVRLAHIWYTDEGMYAEESGGNGSGLKRAIIDALHEDSIVKANSYDYLTGLLNMSYFFDRTEAEKAAILDKDGHPMLLYIDFNGMKFFNAKHGFAEGDVMLQSFAKLLVHAFSNENCCRVGADHFTAITEEAGLEEKLNFIFREFGKLYDGKTPPVHVGIYPYSIEDIPASSACDRAKLACTSLKGTYTSAYRYYSDDLREEAMQKQYVIENIDTALREKWIQVYLQPIIRTVNEKVCDVEALARWKDPEKGVLPPCSFIPVLEEAGLIYKLDLYMLDQVLEAINTQKEHGLYVVPHSINLSRTDFDACDIVEEIRKRVDDAGVERDRITIEITESIIGKDFEFIKKQVERFRELGFPVWMDDFGSGYSSLDVLQSIRFDLIKFDMSFVRRLDEGVDAKTILTDLMRMTTSLGMDTVCEGVETESQVRFLREIGCSKVQGYYYSKPIPFDTILEMYASKTLIENENPKESDYYESIGRVNLFDIGVVASDDENSLQNMFSSIPIAILEVKDDKIRYLRSNRSYQVFVNRFFDAEVPEDETSFDDTSIGYGATFITVVKQCCHNGSSAFFDETMPDGSVIHCFARRINVNPVTGGSAIAIAVLSVSDPGHSTNYADIARIAAMSVNYIVLYVVDPETGNYTQYNPSGEFESFGLAKQGDDFFADVINDAPKAIDPADMERHLRVLTKENMMHDIHENGLFIHNYGLLLNGESVPVSLRAVMKREGDREKVILGVSRVGDGKSGADRQQDKASEEYAELLRENEQLKKEAVVIRRIVELKESVSALLTNMPGMTFSKDIATGRYLACNQSFAEYAGKESPDGVIGLTDFEIFDRATAEHFVEDDKKALSMDGSYVFYEDVPDAAGHLKNLQTTKLKFIDNAGRHCLLGLCLDITEAVRSRQEGADPEEA